MLIGEADQGITLGGIAAAVGLFALSILVYATKEIWKKILPEWDKTATQLQTPAQVNGALANLKVEDLKALQSQQDPFIAYLQAELKEIRVETCDLEQKFINKCVECEGYKSELAIKTAECVSYKSEIAALKKQLEGHREP